MEYNILDKRQKVICWIVTISCLISIVADFSIYARWLPKGFILMAAALIMFLYGLSIKNNKKGNGYFYPFLVIWLIVLSIPSWINSAPVSYGMYFFAIWGSVYLLLDTNMKTATLSLFIKLLSLIMIISLLEYILAVLGISISIGSVSRESERLSSSFQHHLFNLILISDRFPRFQMLAEEPGLIGTICAFLAILLFDKREYKREFIVLVIGGILTFSLAFYIIFAFYFLLKRGSPLKKIIIGIVAILILFIFSSAFQVLILDRFSGGSFSEMTFDNRTSAEFDLYFFDALSKGELFWGKGQADELVDLAVSNGNAGAKVAIYTYGWFAVLVIFFLYNIIFFKQNNKRLSSDALIFLFLFWLSFYQRQTILRPYTIIFFFSAFSFFDFKRRNEVSSKMKLSSESHITG